MKKLLKKKKKNSNNYTNTLELALILFSAYI